MLHEMSKSYRDDILYSEGDDSTTIFFIIDGSVKLYFDAAELLPNTQKFKELKAFNIPFSVQQ